LDPLLKDLKVEGEEDQEEGKRAPLDLEVDREKEREEEDKLILLGLWFVA
jgi:hypothetical protein